VRIGFDWNDDRYITWSYIGTDCKLVANQAEATISFADWILATEAEKKGDVLRVFGQVLGLELEHRHLNFDAAWSSRIAEYWEGEIMDIPWTDLKEYVFDPLLSDRVIMTEEYDENSIMIWPFTRRYAGNTPRDFNYELSDTDKQFIAQLYPKENLEDIPVITMKKETNDEIGYEIAFQLCSNDQFNIKIDFGDGTISDFESYDYRGKQNMYILHSYPEVNSEEFFLKIYLERGNIEELYIHYNWLTSLDVSNSISLKTLFLEGNRLESLDLSRNIELEYLRFNDTSRFYETDHELTSLVFGSNSKLKMIEISGTELTSLTLPVSNELEHISITILPILLNQTAMTELAMSLNDRQNLSSGILSIQSTTSEDATNAKTWIESICREKNWVLE